MKLLSHNHLLCLNKDCKSNAALLIEPKKVIQIESEAKLSFMIHILAMIDYDVLLMAAQQIGIKDLPSALPAKEVLQQESFLRSMQKVLLDSNVVEGRLRCSKCSTAYLIANGVVDMMHPHKSDKSEAEEDAKNDDDDDEGQDQEEQEDGNQDMVDID